MYTGKKCFILKIGVVPNNLLGGLFMPNNKIKKLISLTLAFSIILATSPQTNAANSLILPQAGNHLPTIPVARPAIAQKSTSALYLKNVDKKLSSTLKANNKMAKNDFIIFDEVKGRLVIMECETINAELLKSYVSQKEDIREITITDCSQIEASTFADCVNLEEVTIVDCGSIGENTFSNCNSLRNLKISTCDSIGKSAFSNCNSLTSIEIANCDYIRKNAFSNCNSLNKVSIIAKNLEEAAFSGCTSLEEVTIAACEFLGASAFSGCSSLTKFEFKGGVTEPKHGENVFNGCNSLTKVTVPSNYEMDSFCSKAVDKTGPEYTGGSSSTSSTDNSKTAIIAGSVCAAVAVIIAVAVTLTCYFKKIACFGKLARDSVSEA